MWKKRVSLSVLAGLAGSVAIAMVYVGLISPGCPPTGFGDHGLSLRGVVSSPGWVGYEVEGELFSVDVEAGDTAEQIGPRLTAVMRAAGLLVDCERFTDCQGVYDGECYTFVLRDIYGFPEPESQARGIGEGAGGPLIETVSSRLVPTSWTGLH